MDHGKSETSAAQTVPADPRDQLLELANELLTGNANVSESVERMKFIDDLELKVAKQGGTVGKTHLDELNRKVTGDLTRQLNAQMEATRLLKLAANIERESDPGLGRYEALKRVVKRFRTKYPARRSFAVVNETAMEVPPDSAAARLRDPAFDALCDTDPFFKYWEHPIYAKLGKMPAGELPDGAMYALCALSRSRTAAQALQDIPHTTLEVIYERYGARLYPACLAYLGSGRADALLIPGSKNQTGYQLCRAAEKWPEPQRANLLRLFLEHGWNESLGSLPAEDWAVRLKAEFADSPYGPLR